MDKKIAKQAGLNDLGDFGSKNYIDSKLKALHCDPTNFMCTGTKVMSDGWEDGGRENVCVCVCVRDSVSVYPSICLSICLSVYLSMYTLMRAYPQRRRRSRR